MKKVVNTIFMALGVFLGLVLISFIINFYSLPQAPVDPPGAIKVEHLLSHPKHYLNNFVRFENAEAYQCRYILKRSKFKVKSSESSAVIRAYSNQFYQNGEVLKDRIFLVLPLDCKSEDGCTLLLKEARL